jgi:DNA-binding beta-propeller fold protein YncE
MVAGLSLTCNPFAKKPSVPVVTGPDEGVAGVPLTFKATSEDPDGDSVAFMFDWGDTTSKVWTDSFILSGETISVTHTYDDSNNYKVKAKAKNGKNAESGWSVGHPLRLTGAGPGYPDSLVADIRVWILFERVNSAVVTPDGQYVYMGLVGENRILVMRTSDYAIVDTVTVGSQPRKLILSPDGRRLYVATTGCDSVKALALPGNAIVAQVHVGKAPWDMVLSHEGDYLYTVNAHEDSAARIRVSDFTLEWKIPVDLWPDAIALSPQGDMLYVASFYDSTLTAYSTATRSVVHRLKVGIGLTGLGMTVSGDKLYVGDCELQAHLFVVPSDLSGITKRVNLYGVVCDPAFTPDGFYAIVPTDEYHGLPVLRTDSDELVGWLTTPDGIYCAAAISSDGRSLYAIDNYRGHMRVYR